MTKYLVLIGDGMSDHPLKELGGKTPLEVAKTTSLDFLAKNGTCGWSKNVPPGLEPGSDVAAMSIFGYDPKKCYTGRGPLEAASLGVKLNKGDVAFRCNLVSVEGGKMKDFTAGHISTPEAGKIFRLLSREIGSKEIRFYPGLSYRNLLVIKDDEKGALSKLKTVPPHDITGRQISSYLPRGKGSETLLRLMNESEVILHGMKTKATMIWPWGQGRVPQMMSFRKKYGKRAAVITAVHLLKGLGKTLGMEVINVPGATGYLDTNYKGKAEYALRALKRNDVVFVHVEAPDEAGHEGNIRHKIKAIEDFDRYVVGTILKATRITGYPDIRILVLPDHPTPIEIMTHTAEAVPFVVYPSKEKKGRKGIRKIKGFNEKEIKKSKLKIQKGHELLGKFLGGKL
jgi:2,3-bisphosphoglycerate-independent phosphoglycerate mutase